MSEDYIFGQSLTDIMKMINWVNNRNYKGFKDFLEENTMSPKEHQATILLYKARLERIAHLAKDPLNNEAG